MSLENTLNKLRTDGNMSQERFAEVLGVSRQSVQKWESGACVPELDKLIRIAKHFGISLDALILGRDERFADDINFGRKIRPKYEKMSKWEIYCADLPIEYEQCIDEGLDLKEYGELFRAVSLLPGNDAKARIADVIFDIVLNAKTAEGYPYTEPSDLDGIRRLRRSAPALSPPDKSALEGKILGAWTGRICGCLLGKPIEGVRTDELIPFLKDCGNYPMHRYIMKRDADAEIMKKYRFSIAEFCMADVIDGMPIDDDVNYTVLAQRIVDRHGRDFTSYDVSRDWMTLIGRYSCCTAERVAYRNFVNGYEPPESAVYKNPYREWIGAQIRGDYFGYINPGNPELAAEMAHRDACISHVKNGIYGEMFVAAMLAAAACTDDFEAVVSCGLAQIPCTSRLHEAVTDVLNGYRKRRSRRAMLCRYSPTLRRAHGVRMVPHRAERNDRGGGHPLRGRRFFEVGMHGCGNGIRHRLQRCDRRLRRRNGEGDRLHRRKLDEADQQHGSHLRFRRGGGVGLRTCRADSEAHRIREIKSSRVSREIGRSFALRGSFDLTG